MKSFFENWETWLFSKCKYLNTNFVTNLDNKLPSKHLLVFKTSWRRLQDMSWRRLQHVFSIKILPLPRRLGGRKIVMLKTSSRRLEDMSWRCMEDISWGHYGDKQNTYWGYLHLTNLKVYLTNLYYKSISDNSKANPKCID